MPKVSVIIPVFNVEDYLPECLDSVLNQTFHDLEIICIDDASTDNSLRILKEYENKDSRIAILQNEQNRGLAYTRNRGIEQALGEFILFVDSDDYIEVSLIAATIDKIDRVDMVCFNYRKKDEIWNDDDKHLFKIKEGMYKAHDFFAASVNQNSIVHSAWSKLYRRDFLVEQNIRFIDGILYEDISFYFLCMLKAHEIYCISDKLYIYRVRNSSIMTKKTGKKNIVDYFRSICYISRFYLEGNFDDELEQTIEKYIQIIYHSFISIYRRYALANDAYQLKKDIAEENYAKIYGIISGCENYCGEVQECIAKHIELIKSAKQVIVYGAGDIAREVLETLSRYDIAIDGIAVSDQSNNRKSLFGNRVYAITEYIDKKEASLIIIATSPQFYPEIRKYLSELGFEHFIEIF